MDKLQARSLQVGVPDRRKSSIDEGEFRLVYTESKNLKNLYGKTADGVFTKFVVGAQPSIAVDKMRDQTHIKTVDGTYYMLPVEVRVYYHIFIAQN